MATTTTGITVKEGKGSSTFTAGSIFAINVKKEARVVIAEGLSLTLESASSVGETTVKYCAGKNISANLCVLNLHQPTVTGIGLICRGPASFSFQNLGDAPVSLLGNINGITASAAQEAAQTSATAKVEADETVETKKRKLDKKPAAESPKKSVKQTSDESPQKSKIAETDQKSESKEEDAPKEGDEVPKKLSKKQRKKLALKKAKELEETVAKLNGHIAKDGAVKLPARKPPGSITKERRLAGGVLVRDMLLGQGTSVKAGRKVGILYEGSLQATGKVFDRKQTKPLVFRQGTGQVVRGLEKGLEGMRVGGERDITIPPELGYGKKGSGHVIPSNSTLVFSVRLVSVGH